MASEMEGLDELLYTSPLEWTKAWGPDQDGDESHSATTPFGPYSVERWCGQWRWRYCFDEYYDEEEADCSSIDEGKILAQEHWDRRIQPLLASRRLSQERGQ